MPRVSGHLEPWKTATLSFEQAGRRTAIKTVPARVAVKWAPRQRDRVLRELADLGPARALDNLKLLVVDLKEPRERPAAWRELALLRDQGVIAWATPLVLDVESGLGQIVTDEITVRLRPGVAADRWLEKQARHGLVLDRPNEFVPNQFVLRVEGTFGLDTLQRATDLDKDDNVDFATPNFISEVVR
jgi:hypothetical protein